MVLTTPLKLTIQDITVEGLLKACYIGSVLGYKFYEPVREQCLFNALKEDLAANFLQVMPQETDKADSLLRDSITNIRDEYIMIASRKNITVTNAVMFGTKARLKIVLEVLDKITPNPFPRTTDVLKNGAAFDKVIAYAGRHRWKIQDFNGDILSIDETCFFLAQAHLLGFLQTAHIFNVMSIGDIISRKFIPRGRSDPQ
jgi:hypothetical protein